MEALLAFAAALVALRLSGDLARRYRSRRRPELAAWAAGLAAYALAAGALAWGAAAGWSEAAFRVYYLGGGLLTAALLGVGSLLLVGRSWARPTALVYVGLAIGVAVAAPLQVELSGTEIPEAQDVLAFWPARILAILGNSLGTLAVVAVAISTFRARPLGNVLVLAGIAVAAVGSGLAGLGVGALAPAVALAAVLLYAGFVAPSTLAVPRPHEHGHDPERDRRLDDGAGDAPMAH
ncbi:MAG TPA: hypothetical protein VEW90_11715 [Gaiellaceae bacterium]|nr:hypothetical protein [Gaiellaceae bacterium]